MAVCWFCRLNLLWDVPLAVGRSVGFALFSLFEDIDAKVLASGTFLLRNLCFSTSLFLFLFNASGEKIGSLARSASSFTNSTRSWKDTAFSVFLSLSRAWRQHLDPEYEGNFEEISWSNLEELSSSICFIDCIAPSQRVRKSEKSCKL